MASSIFGPKQGGNSALEAVSQLRSLGSPQAAAQHLMGQGATCTLPDGRKANIHQLADMVRGKSPVQAFREMGVDPSHLRGTI